MLQWGWKFTPIPIYNSACSQFVRPACNLRPVLGMAVSCHPLLIALAALLKH